MPKIFVTRTLGPNILKDTMRSLPAQTIRALDEQNSGKPWYRMIDHGARGKDIRARAAAAMSEPAVAV